jgi:FixJ family two-component response regulator
MKEEVHGAGAAFRHRPEVIADALLQHGTVLKVKIRGQENQGSEVRKDQPQQIFALEVPIVVFTADADVNMRRRIRWIRHQRKS